MGAPEIAVLVIEHAAPTQIPPRGGPKTNTMILEELSCDDRYPGTFEEHDFFTLRSSDDFGQSFLW